MYKVAVFRDKFFDGKATLGTLLVYDDDGKQIFKKESLERGWLDNQRRISCVPVGVYDLVLEYSDKFRKDLWELKGVPNRSECKIHAANYWNQLNGCIALGNARKYIDRDLILDVTSSRDTMKFFHEVMAGQTKAKIHVFDVPALLYASI